MLLTAQGIEVSFGGVRALVGASLEVELGTIHGLVGPNGSGKTTLMNCISGFIRPNKGEIIFEGNNTHGIPAFRRSRMGIGRTFQHPGALPELDAIENVRIGSHFHDPATYMKSLRPISGRLQDRTEREIAAKFLAGEGISDVLAKAGHLSYGQQRLVDLARCLAGKPRLLLLDEPAAGLSEDEIDILRQRIGVLRTEGATVLISDHNMPFMMSLCDVLTVFDFGRDIAHGDPESIRENKKVAEAYLGKRAADLQQDPHRKEREISTEASGGYNLVSPDVRTRSGSTTEVALTISMVSSGYRAADAIRSVSLSCHRSEIVTLVGGNGAGKSTTLLTASGVLRARTGRIDLLGHEITAVNPARRVAMGLAHVPEGRRMIPGLTVRENLLMGAYVVRSKIKRRDLLDEVMDRFPILRERMHQLSGTLSGGEQQMLAIGRALMADPKVLLLDEPTMGLAPVVVDVIVETVLGLKSMDLGILLVEQNAQVALDVADYGYVLARGEIIAEGTPSDLRSSGVLQKAYLGSVGL